MRHSGNTATVVDCSYGGEGVTLKIYVDDEVGRFVTVTSLSLGLKDLHKLVEGVHRRRAELDDQTQDALFD